MEYQYINEEDFKVDDNIIILIDGLIGIMMLFKVYYIEYSKIKYKLNRMTDRYLELRNLSSRGIETNFECHMEYMRWAKMARTMRILGSSINKSICRLDAILNRDYDYFSNIYGVSCKFIDKLDHWNLLYSINKWGTVNSYLEKHKTDYFHFKTRYAKYDRDELCDAHDYMLEENFNELKLDRGYYTHHDWNDYGNDEYEFGLDNLFNRLKELVEKYDFKDQTIIQNWINNNNSKISETFSDIDVYIGI